MRGRWNQDFFHNDNPIVLELGCGRGEYTVGLARRYPGKNFIGVDIKGARMWHGARDALKSGMKNVGFLRTSIEFIHEFFAQDEVSEIWLTFSDPQMKKATKRLSSTWFMQRYRKMLADGGLIHLKTDSPFLDTYTREMLRASGIQPNADTADLYAGPALIDLDIRTHYEQQWLDRGLTIKYLQWPLFHAANLVEPDIEFYTDRNGLFVDLRPSGSNGLSFTGLFEREMAHFVDCVQNGTPCRAPAKDGVILMKMIDAIYESAATGHEVIIK